MAHQVDHPAQQGLYEYDAVSRLRDSQLGDERVHDVANYIKRGKLWEAFAADGKVVLLIDEIDKADIEFPNDLLQELDRMEFTSTRPARRSGAHPAHRHHHLEQRKGTAGRLPAPLFLPLHPLPDAETMKQIVEVHYPGIKGAADQALTQFYEIREQPGLKKKPSTSEVLDWLKLLLAEDLTPETARSENAATWDAFMPQRCTARF
jgi:MoxR-like ATPase